MATKTLTKKTNTKTNIETVPAKEIVEPPVTKREFQPNDEISTTSVTAGELIMIGRKTGTLYRWADYGDTEMVEYQDLRAEKYNSKSRYMYDPLFVIDDEDVLESPEFKNVVEVYNNILSVEDIDNVFNLDAMSFKRTLETLPKGLKNTMKVLAVTKIQDGTLDSIQKIKIIDSVLGTDLFNSYLGEE